ncbi:MAG: glycosyltransferase family 2 protein [Bacteroidales bacterium]|nr:glycosyltransferase family 2 protein [Bacteroidales bacterium]
MFKNKKTAVVIPTYKAAAHLEDVIRGLPEMIDHIIVVDDKCPQNTGKIAVEMQKTDPRLVILFHEANQGVGGAVVTGYKKALELGCEIVVKMDSDDQMDPVYLPGLISPIVEGQAGYTKGNRFVDFKALRAMPGFRLFGNSVLSFLVKACSGYWNLMDPTNGYTAISSSSLQKINLDKLAKRFFFETDMLIRLNIQNTVIKDVPIPARYGSEQSTLSIRNTMVRFPFLLIKGLTKRFILKYLIYDFNMASVYILTGMPMLLWGIFYGLFKWIENTINHVATPTGTIMLSVLPLILGTQFVIAAINIDINSTPKN